MKWVQIFGYFSRNLHIKTDRNVALSQEQNDQVYEDPIILKHLVMSIEPHFDLSLTEVFYGESNDDAYKKELNFAQETLPWRSLNSVNVENSICVNVPISEKGNDVWEAVLAKQEFNDERTLFSVVKGHLIRCIIKSRANFID